jgi:hypothetical protein
VLLLEVSTPKGPKLFWTCLHYRGMCCSWRCLPTPQGPELLLNVSALLRYVLLLEVSTQQGPELHLNVSALQRLVLLLEVSTPQGPELHLNVSALQRPVLLLEVSTPQGPKLIWMCLRYRVLCCSWRSLIHRDQCLLTVKCVPSLRK